LLEYEADAPDLLDILEKQRDVKFRLNTGEEMVLPMRLTRILSRDANVWFALEIPSERNQRAGQQLRDLLRMNLESRLVLDEATGLPNRETCFGFFDSVHHLIATQGQTAAIVALRMDRYEKSLARYGKIGCTQLMQHLAGSCRRMVSDEDVVCQLNDQTLALFLMNFSRESARVMLNRLRWLLRSHRIDFGGKSEFSVTVSIAFDIIHGNAGEGALQRCEDAVMALDTEARNQLLEPAV
jgi:diguanylate cyclase (GGDEF)-like protein